jgi:hypothetical protein
MKDYWLVILLTFVGFTALAALLLIPVWKFLIREEKSAEAWDESLADHSGKKEG